MPLATWFDVEGLTNSGRNRLIFIKLHNVYTQDAPAKCWGAVFWRAAVPVWR